MNQNYNGIQQNNNENNNSINQSLQGMQQKNVQQIKQQPYVRIVETSDKVNGQNKCPRCGATGAIFNIEKGVLVCTSCRYEFQPEQITNMVDDLSKLQGQVIGSGATNIDTYTNNIVTLKCSSCGAEVVVDTSTSTNIRCHWCRNALSINQKVANGTVPDIILPFKIKKEDAKIRIEKFMFDRNFFAHPEFKKGLVTENIMGVFFPYMVVDINAHSTLVGEGEHLTRKYTVDVGDSKENRYDADLYHVERNFDITISGLTVESSIDKLNTNAKDKTNNIINSIMPFDIENSVKYNSNYMVGFSSEKRDINIDDLRALVSNQAKDITRFAANDFLKFYDRGIRWDKEEINIKGQQWKAAYLPVWLYSYQEVKGNKKILHYVAVNGRTGETMGSIPLYTPKLLCISILIELFIYLPLFITFGFLAFLYIPLILPGFIFYWVMFFRYHNYHARHYHETETKRNILNMKAVDEFIKSKHGLRYIWMSDSNNTKVQGTNVNFYGPQLVSEKLKEAENNLKNFDNNI